MKFEYSESFSPESRLKFKVFSEVGWGLGATCRVGAGGQENKSFLKPWEPWEEGPLSYSRGVSSAVAKCTWSDVI